MLILTIPPIDPSETRPSKPHINHVTIVETFFEEERPIGADSFPPNLSPSARTLLKSPAIIQGLSWRLAAFF